MGLPITSALTFLICAVVHTSSLGQSTGSLVNSDHSASKIQKAYEWKGRTLLKTIYGKSFMLDDLFRNDDQELIGIQGKDTILFQESNIADIKFRPKKRLSSGINFQYPMISGGLFAEFHLPGVMSQFSICSSFNRLRLYEELSGQARNEIKRTYWSVGTKYYVVDAGQGIYVSAGYTKYSFHQDLAEINFLIFPIQSFGGKAFEDCITLSAGYTLSEGIIYLEGRIGYVESLSRSLFPDTNSTSDYDGSWMPQLLGNVFFGFTF